MKTHTAVPMKLDDSTLGTVSGGRGLRMRCPPMFKTMRLVDIAQTNVAVVVAPGNTGTIDIDQSNTAVVL